MIVIYIHDEWVALDKNSQDAETIAIVPAQDVLLTTAELPKLSRQRLMLALPFALEEQLIDDVSQLHFAASDYQTDSPLSVAVVAQEKMNAWMLNLKEAGITPTMMVPATLALPFTPDHWHIGLSDTLATVRTGKYSGFACEKDNLAAFIKLKLAENEKKPECIHIHNTSGQSLNLAIPDIVINEIKIAEKPFLEDMATWVKSTPTINLLQGTYRPKIKSSQTKKIWQAAGCLAAIWLLLAFFSQMVSFFILRHENNQIETAINAIYSRHFPSATHVVEPRARLESKLKKISLQTEKNGFFNLLGMVGDKLAQAPNIHLLNLEFREGQLNLGVTADTFNTLDSFTQALTHQGLRVAQKNAGMVDKQVKANIFIQAGG